MKNEFDIAIIGAGISGLSLALRLLERKPDLHLLIVDKETSVAAHASGRNSGVLHAGFYYSADSLKAKLCVAGNRAMKDYCRAHGIPMNESGKLVVPVDPEDLPRLEELEKRGRANGAGIETISEEEARKIQPGVRCLGKAIFSPETATVDPLRVCQVIKEDIEARGGKFSFDTAFVSPLPDGFLSTRGEFRAGRVLNCAGLYADRIARQYGLAEDYTLLPFKGLYLKYAKNKSDVSTNVYPVPDPRFPFLGVHFTKTVDGTIKIGPTAIPGFWRENYTWSSRFSALEVVEILRHEAELFIRNSFHFRDLAIEEMKKYVRPYFISLSKKLVPTIDASGFNGFTKPGIRAQLLRKSTRELVQDFVIESDGRSVHLLNAVSPAFTCSFAFAEFVISKYLGDLL